jgi:hypothetical protein
VTACDAIHSRHCRHTYRCPLKLWRALEGIAGTQLLILPAALGPASNRNDYQKQKEIMFLGSRARPVSRADSLTDSLGNV